MSKSASNVKLSQKEIQDYQEAFSFFDDDKDGLISIQEVGKVMRSIGLYPSEHELLEISKITRSKVNFNEFLNLASRNIVDNKINEQQMQEAFRMFDLHGNGMVNLAHLRVSLQSLGEKLRDEEIDEMIRECDIDAEGNVRCEELVRILTKN
ncbi:calmodulin [Brachionus plicatilis]|uniref:Calmodulin n=1 Tax=Brachionus plicatilis TaxID=10195 RepID=A0A3M7S1D1_BRAPC|nr:calmodulin [Brachionus plicatilis]